MTKRNEFDWIPNSQICIQKFISLTFRQVEIEEIRVQQCLNAAGDNSNWVKETLKIPAINPIEDVKPSVKTPKIYSMIVLIINQPTLC